MILSGDTTEPAIPAPVKPVKKGASQADTPDNKLSRFIDELFQSETEKIAGKVAIVIDDLGYSISIAEKFLQLDSPISFSILPGLPYSRLIASWAHELNRDILLHLPMEPDDYPNTNPGPGTLFKGMSPEELGEQLLKDLDAIPYMTGTNNHMGSKLTEDKDVMRLVMEKIKDRGIFFLDSRTSLNSVAYSTAKEYGIKAAKRNIFLDNENDVELISRQIIKLGERALKNGTAIGIGHPNQNTLIALKQTIPKLKERGIKIVPVSQLVN